MKDVLRKEWGFEGVVITDYAAIAELITHGVAADQKEASQLAMEADVDIDMCTGCYGGSLEELIREGRLTMEQLDAAVWRVLRLKNKLGLFEDPFRGADAAEEERLSLCADFRALSREAAVKCSVLLENKDGLLPLSPEAGEAKSRRAGGAGGRRCKGGGKGRSDRSLCRPEGRPRHVGDPRRQKRRGDHPGSFCGNARPFL